MLGTYPNNVDVDSEDAEKQKEDIEKALKPIVEEVKRLNYKIKELAPVVENVKKEDKQSGLELHIMFIQAVNPEMGYLDRSISVSSLKKMYDAAVDKNKKINAKQNG